MGGFKGGTAELGAQRVPGEAFWSLWNAREPFTWKLQRSPDALAVPSPRAPLSLSAL